MYKLIALDIDGTLIKSNGEVCPSTITAIKRAVQAGAIVTIVTGRTPSGITKFVELFNLHSPMIVYNGAMIVEAGTNKCVYSECLQHNDVRHIIDMGKEFNTTMVLWTETQQYVNKIDAYVDMDTSFHGVEPVVLDDLNSIANLGIAKILFLDDPGKILSMKSAIPNKINDSVSFCQSHPNYLEFFDNKVSKAHALAMVAKIYGIKQEEVIAIGDGENDIPMLEYAGLGVAMGNANQIVKSIANYVTSSNDECGIANALEKFLTFEQC